jgi:hypothetical protein
MMSRRNMAGVVLATALPLAPLAPAQPRGGAALPDPGDVTTAYLAARRWLMEFRLPGPDEPAARVPIAGASGVCVIIRGNGRVLGTGTSGREPGDLMLRRAAGEAFGKALAHPLLAELPEALRERSGSHMTLELEIAGSLEPLLGRLESIDEQCEPGLDGLALRHGERVAFAYPSLLLATRRADDLRDVASSLAIELDLPGQGLDQALERGQLALYRMRTIQLAQDEPGGTPFPLFRGQVIVDGSHATPEGTARLADQLAARIVRALRVSTGGIAAAGPWNPPRAGAGVSLLGDYDLIADTYEPLLAPPLDQALLALALARYASAPRVHADVAGDSRALAIETLQGLAHIKPGTADPLEDPQTAAAVVYAACELIAPAPGGGPGPSPATTRHHEIASIAAAAAGRVAASFRAGHGFVQTDGRLLDGHGQALLAGAAARALVMDIPCLTAEQVVQAVDQAWTSVPEQRQVALLPWIAWAERDLARAAPLQRPGDRLAGLHGRLRQSRVDGADAAPDLVGGFALARGRSSRASARRVTAQSLRPAVSLAGALREMSAAEVAAGLPGHMLTVRYLMQLTVREEGLFSVRNPHAALGGVRASTWDSRLPAAAGAMGLLLAAETLVSLEALGVAVSRSGPGSSAGRPP